uniref:Arylacetamide deacetylase like 2 n=1 Tax=Jaculus jaculus TaxID=51337 RepID=A0A8C5KBZ1_JACJA|nr:arylacetamide deacetylase-like 2 [Jaculus jaculus]
MGLKTLCLGIFCVIFLSYIYTPIPDNIEETWKVMTLDAVAKASTFMATCLENVGIMSFDEFISMIIRMDYTQPISDENITVTDTAFAGIPVRLYLPKKKSETSRRAVIYIHGGGFCFGSFKQRPFDFLNRWTANILDAVVVGVDYRLAPHHHFPAQFEDGMAAIQFFLQDKILTKYGVDPARIAIAGDSSGGTLTAALTQQIHSDPSVKHKFRAQVLVYPGLQAIDTYLPAHQENEHAVVLTRDVAIKLLSLYFTKDAALPQAMRRNHHMPEESRFLFQFVNWSALLPEKYQKGYVYREPVLGISPYPLSALMDSRAFPLLANDSQLQNLPLTYIITCQYDLLRDDGLMYVSRLQNVGVQVAHDHVEDGIHGALSYMTAPFYLQLGLQIRDMYISWLEKNL